MTAEKLGGQPPEEPERQVIGFAMEPEELLEALGEDPADFVTLAYTPPERRGEVTVIDADEFEKAQRDPKVIAFIREARAEGERQKERDRIRLQRAAEKLE